MWKDEISRFNQCDCRRFRQESGRKASFYNRKEHSSPSFLIQRSVQHWSFALFVLHSLNMRVAPSFPPSFQFLSPGCRLLTALRPRPSAFVIPIRASEDTDASDPPRTLSVVRTRFIDALTTVAVSRFKLVDTSQQQDLRQSFHSSAPLGETGEENDGQCRLPELTNPGFSFSAAGFLFPYHLGVGQCLIENGYITENTPLAGSSAGALVSAVIASGLTMNEAMLATKELAADCRENGTAFRLGVVLRKALDECLPEDAHLRTSGRIQVAITQLFQSPRALLVSRFNSKKDLIDGLLTSCFIPGYFAPRPITMYRKRVCVDGGLTQFIPPTSADRTISVCAFSASGLGLEGVGISPDCSPMREKISIRQLLRWALEPANDDILDDFFDFGYEDALAWVTTSGYRDLMTGVCKNQTTP